MLPKKKSVYTSSTNNSVIVIRVTNSYINEPGAPHNLEKDEHPEPVQDPLFAQQLAVPHEPEDTGVGLLVRVFFVEEGGIEQK